MALSAGAHRIELRAPDYETLTFSVMIEPNGLVRYRGDMQRIAHEAAGCYRAVPACTRAGEKLLRHTELLRRRQAALRNVAQGLRPEETANAEIGRGV